MINTVKNETLKEVNNKKSHLVLDDIDMEDMKEELAKICKASSYVMEISGQLVLNFEEKIAPTIKENLLNFFALNLHNYKTLTEDELLDATCFFCDFIEYSYHTDINMIVELTNKFLEIFSITESFDVKQTLSYGIGVFSMFTPQTTFTPLLSKSFTVR